MDRMEISIRDCPEVLADLRRDVAAAVRERLGDIADDASPDLAPLLRQAAEEIAASIETGVS